MLWGGAADKGTYEECHYLLCPNRTQESTLPTTLLLAYVTAVVWEQMTSQRMRITFLPGV